MSRDEYAERKECHENCMDELEENKESVHHRDTFTFAVNTAISSMNRRFTSRKAILTDFDLLNPPCFQKSILKAVVCSVIQKGCEELRPG